MNITPGNDCISLVFDPNQKYAKVIGMRFEYQASTEGLQGTTGPQGPLCLQGPARAEGADGNQGMTGEKGDKGDPGVFGFADKYGSGIVSKVAIQDCLKEEINGMDCEEKMSFRVSLAASQALSLEALKVTSIDNDTGEPIGLQEHLKIEMVKYLIENCEFQICERIECDGVDPCEDCENIEPWNRCEYDPDEYAAEEEDKYYCGKLVDVSPLDYSDLKNLPGDTDFSSKCVNQSLPGQDHDYFVSIEIRQGNKVLQHMTDST